MSAAREDVAGAEGSVADQAEDQPDAPARGTGAAFSMRLPINDALIVLDFARHRGAAGAAGSGGPGDAAGWDGAVAAGWRGRCRRRRASYSGCWRRTPSGFLLPGSMLSCSVVCEISKDRCTTAGRRRANQRDRGSFDLPLRSVTAALLTTAEASHNITTQARKTDTRSVQVSAWTFGHPSPCCS